MEGESTGAVALCAGASSDAAGAPAGTAAISRRVAEGRDRDATATAAADGICKCFGPVSAMLEEIFGYQIPEEFLIDNEAAEQVIESGTSIKLAYMKRTQKVSLGMVSDYVNDVNTTLHGIDSNKNSADGGTKALDHVKHWEQVNFLGMG